MCLGRSLASSSNTLSEDTISPGGRNITVSFPSERFEYWQLNNVLDILSAALDSGVAVSAVVIFFTYALFQSFHISVLTHLSPSLQYPRNGMIGFDTIQAWWGNTVYMNTADYKGLPLKYVVDGFIYG